MAVTITKQIASNTLWQIIGKAIGTALGVAWIALLTRYLGQENFGYYSTALAFMQFFGVLVDMGLYLVCLQEISKNGEKQNYILSNIFTLRFFSALIFLGGGSLLIFAFPYSPVVKWSAALSSLAFFFISLVQIITPPFQKYLKMGWVAMAETAGRLGMLLTIVAFIYWRLNLPWLMFCNVTSGLITFLILWFLVKKFITVRWAFDFSYWKTIISKAWPIALGIAFNLVYFRADTVILSLFRSAAEVGIYSAPYKVLEIIATFPHMFMGMVMPILTAAWLAKNLEKFRSAMQKTFDFFILLIMPMIFISIPLSSRLMILLAGPKFAASGEILPILMLATGIIFIGTLFTYIIVILEKQKTMLKYYFSAAALSMIGYFIFIPRYSYFGAAWVTVIIEFFIALSACILTFKFSRISLSLNIFWKAMLASIIMIAILYWLISWPTVWLIILGMAIYGLVMVAIKGINKQLLADILK